MSLQSQLAMFIGGFAVCLAIMIPLMSRWNETQPPADTPHEMPQMAGVPPKPLHHSSAKHPSGFERPKVTKPPKKSWIVFLAPVYAVGVCAYVLYIIYIITTKQRRRANFSLNSRSRYNANRQRQHKAALSQEEIGVLENRLNASEKAVDEILRKAHTLMTEAYQKGLDEDESSLSDSSDLTDSSEHEKSRAKITELATTSSANNDTHQDTSSASEGRVLTHHRKKHRARLPSDPAKRSSSSSEDEDESATHLIDSADVDSSLLDSEEEDSEDVSSCDLSDLPSSEEDSKEGRNFLPSQPPQHRAPIKISAKGEQPQDEINLASHGDSKEITDQNQETNANPKNASRDAKNTPRDAKKTNSDIAKTGENTKDRSGIKSSDNINDVGVVETVGRFEEAAKSIEKSLESDSTKTQFLDDKEKLMSTTKDVLNAMDDLRDLIKEQKAD